jgi:hypothetical protein
MLQEAGTANRVDFRSLVYAASTHPQPDASFPLGKPTSEKWIVPITEDDEEEREWDALFARPDVQAGLDRLEEEATQQFFEGKTIKGGFAVE